MGNLKVITFPELPVHDTIWSITTGSDGKVYAGICGELTGGLSVFLVSYDPVSEQTEYVMEVAKELKEPPDNGRATHSKIHTCLVGSGDGKLYIKLAEYNNNKFVVGRKIKIPDKSVLSK